MRKLQDPQPSPGDILQELRNKTLEIGNGWRTSLSSLQKGALCKNMLKT